MWLKQRPVRSYKEIVKVMEGSDAHEVSRHLVRTEILSKRTAHSIWERGRQAGVIQTVPLAWEVGIPGRADGMLGIHLHRLSLRQHHKREALPR